MLRTVFAASLAACAPAASWAQAAPRAAPVIVTASPLAGDAERFATIVDSVGRDDILASGGANLAEALGGVPGVAGTAFAAGASRPVIRGMDAERVKILENGIGSFDVSELGPDHGVPIDPLSTQRIEVVRGAGVLRFGGQAIGGVVNAINNRVPLSLPNAPISGEATGAYANAAATGEGAVLLDGRLGQFAGHLDAYSRHSSDYDIPGGSQPNSFFRGAGYSGGASYFFGADDKSRVGAALTHFDARYGIPGEDAFIDMRQTKASSKSFFATDAGALEGVAVDLGYGAYLHDEREADGAIAATFKNREWDGRAEATFAAMGPLSGAAIGLQVQNRRYSGIGENEDFLSPARTQSAALFAFAEAPLSSALQLQAGARLERIEVKGTPASGTPTTVDFTPFSGAAGVLYTVNDALKLGLTFSSAARAPSQVELFARGPHEGTATFDTGDPDLKRERSNALEATARVRVGPFSLDGSLWGARFSKYIFGDLTGRTCEDDGTCEDGDALELRELFYRQNDAKFWGAEAKASYALGTFGGGALTARALADYVRAKFDGGGEIPRIQPWRAGGGLSWESPRLDLGFMAMHVGKRDDIAAFETPTDSYLDVQAQAIWRATEQLEFALVGRNLTDDGQRNAVALNKDEVIQPGRDIRLVARAAF